MFQSIPINQYVDLVLCRGYPLPPDVDLDSDDPLPPPPPPPTTEPQQALQGGEVVTAVPLINGQPLLVKGDVLHGSSQELHYVTTDASGRPMEINRQNVQTLSHAQVVDILKDFSVGSEVNILVLRGGQTSPVKSLKPRQEMTASTETLDTITDATPQALPYHSNTNTLRSSDSPKRDITEMYLKSKALLESRQPHTKDIDVFLKRDIETGFGFRVLGGEGPQQPNVFPQVYIGAIVPNGAAEKDGRLRAGDELIGIDGVMVKGRSHKQVLDLMTNAARNGQVMLTVRRKIAYRDAVDEDVQEMAPVLVNGSPKLPRLPMPSALDHESFDITLHRRENEGFGFVILTSKSKPPYGVIPHKIGRIIEGSPTDRCGLLHVGDRISAVNGRSIIELSHNDIVQLIKEAGTVVTLTVVPEDEYKGPPSGASSAKQSPALQHRAMSPRSPFQDERLNLDLEEKRDGSNWSEQKTLPLGEPGTLCVTGPNQGCLTVELERSPVGFGFSLRGGTEYNMGLYILRLADNRPAQLDGRIHVGDEIVEINGEPARGISHTRAIELIQAGGSKVVLLLRPGAGASVFLSPTFSRRLKHVHSWSAKSLQGPEPRHSRGLGSVEESDEWAEQKVERLSPLSYDQTKVYKRTLSTKDSRELSSPKKTGETFPKAKEQHHSPKQAESPAQGATLSRSRMASNAKTQMLRSEKPQTGPQVELQRTEHQPVCHRRLKDSSSRGTLGNELKNGDRGNVQTRRYTIGSGERPSLDKESFKRRVAGEAHPHRTPVMRQSDKSRHKNSEIRNAEGKRKPTENQDTSKSTSSKRDSLSFLKDLWSKKDSVVTPKEAKGRERTSISKEDFVASTNSIPGSLQTTKGPASPRPWKVPSSAKILTEEEVFRDPL
uniref:Membrane associated guanylate kinase, WW and PDZ domain containing 3 n=2 Tax=Nothobranchius rachovii TaxID=451742 RepID=A0A1A8S333_9TELE